MDLAMPKYQKGETSPENIKNSAKITNSIITKTKLLNNALMLDTIPPYIPLNAKRTKINIGDIHSWEDKELKVFKYTVNTAKTKKNDPFLNKLLDAIYNFNKKIPHWINKENTEEKVKKSTYKTRAALELEINELKNTTETLNNVVVEVFRGYEQLKSFIVTHHFDNKQYHSILNSHFHVNPKDRLKLIK
jgi:FtsZ-binding cell division protein ZapB